MKTLIAMVRHGVTDWNYDGRGQGHTDIKLNAEGRLQAEAVADKLASERWDAIYSSPLSRARMTADAIARRSGLPVVLNAQLIERHLGACEGLTIWERRARFGSADWAQLGGEPDGEVADRARAVMTQIAEANPGGRILCVTHGGLIAVFLRSLKAGGLAHTRNTSVSRVLFDGETFTPDGPAEYDHLLVDGLEYSGERSRLRPRPVAELVGGNATAEYINDLVMRATAVETAWSGEEVVGVLAASIRPDGGTGSIDIVGMKPGFDRALDRMRHRLATRFPAVSFS